MTTQEDRIKNAIAEAQKIFNTVNEIIGETQHKNTQINAIFILTITQKGKNLTLANGTYTGAQLRQAIQNLLALHKIIQAGGLGSHSIYGGENK